MKFFLPCLFLLPLLTRAQSRSPLEIGASIHAATYEGDLHSANLNFGNQSSKPAYSLHVRKPLNSTVAVRLQLLAGALAGDDKNYTRPAWRQVRGVSFSSPLYEISAAVELYPFGYHRDDNPRSKPPLLRPFILLGIGGAYTAPDVDWNDPDTNEEIDPALARIDQFAKTKTVHLVAPLGGGLRIALGRQWSIHLEGALRPTFSDYVDGFSKAGNPKAKDWYLTLGGGIGYAFGSAGKSHKPTPPMHQDADENPVVADRDNDGIADERDECPDAPGLRALKGCPDSDKDGVPDKFDACPESPGVAAAAGCPLSDRDKDGIGDEQDLCPDMPGEAQWKGCPDSDDDGIPDNKDDCPGIPGLSTLKGCPDTDHDGVADRNDECPTLAGSPAKKGCPDAPAPAPGVPYKAVYFNSTLQDWQGPSLATLNEVVEILKKDPGLKVRIEGHTDNTGEEPANDLLSERRAKKCRDYLVSKGIDAERLNFVGYGSDKPVADNSNPKGRQLNRRVEIHFVR